MTPKLLIHSAIAGFLATMLLSSGCKPGNSSDASTPGTEEATPSPSSSPSPSPSSTASPSPTPSCNEFSGFCTGPTVNLTASPLNPADIKYVSKFYSCNGHAYPEPTDHNSAKHYFYPINSKENTNDQVPLYAACAGTVRMMTNDNGENPLPNGYGVRGRRFHLFCDNSSTALEYFHVNFNDSLLETHVNAGDLLGHADTRVGGTCMPDGCSDFDISMADGNDDATVSIFARMSAEVAALWAARGITDASVVTRSPAPVCSSWLSEKTDTDNWFQLTSR